MTIRSLLLPLACALALAVPAAAAPLVIGETITMPSKALSETRRINIYLPVGHDMAKGAPLPVLYMPDGGMQEDFLHVAGLLQVGAANGTVRPFILVGIENTQRRRDLTGPTTDAEDRKIAPRVGDSQAYRDFIRTELMPEIARRYRVTGERAIVGESLAGLFVLETLMLEPDLFDTYIAIDPSLWWNKGALVQRARTAPPSPSLKGKRIFIANSSEEKMAGQARDIAGILNAKAGASVQYEAMPAETHLTIYHPAALKAFRALLKP